MSRRKCVLTLTSVCEIMVGNNVWWFLQLHSVQCQSSCREIVPEEPCEYFNRQKKEFGSSIPTEISQRIMKTLREKNWKPSVDVFLTSRTFQMKYLIYHFFVTDSFETDFEYLTNKYDKIAVMRRYMRSFDKLNLFLILEFPVPDPLAFWRGIFVNALKLQVLVLNFVVVTDVILTVIGCNCSTLRELRNLTISEDVSVDSFKKFCFRIYPENSEKNPCCSTLELVEISEFNAAHPNALEWDFGIDPRKVGGCTVLIENLPNLKGLGNSIDSGAILEYYFENSERHVTNLGELIIKHLNEYLMRIIVRLCPELRSLRVERCTLDSLSHLMHFNNLTSLSISVYLLELLEKLLETEIPKLKFLDIRTMCVVNVSKMVVNYPNLESLSCSCENIICTTTISKFSNLRNYICNFFATIETDPWVTASLVVEVMPSLETLCLNNFILDEQIDRNVVLSYLLSIRCPNLKILIVNPVNFTPQSIRELVDRFPLLEKLGGVSATDMKHMNNIKMEFQRNNLNIELLPPVFTLSQ